MIEHYDVHVGDSMEHFFSNPENIKNLLLGIAAIMAVVFGVQFISLKKNNKKTEGNGTIIDQSGSTISNGDQVAGSKTIINNLKD